MHGAAVELLRQRDHEQHRPIFPVGPVAPRRCLGRLERALAALPDPLRLGRAVFAGQLDIGNLGHRNADPPCRGLVEHLDVRGAAVIDKADQRAAVATRHGDIPAVVERAIDARGECFTHS